MLGGKRLPLDENFQDNGIRYARAEDVKNKFLDIDNSPFISKETHNLLQRYVTKENDIILTIVGNSIGDVALNKLNSTINLTENCARLVNAPVSIFLYLNCRYGQAQIRREKVGTAQPKLAIERIREFFIPRFEQIESYLSDLVSVSWQCIKDCKTAYKKAEDLLNEYLKIGDISQENAYAIKNFLESFNSSGRLDAEYYQPKYDRLKKQIGTDYTIASLCNIYDNNYIPDDKKEYNYIELANVVNMGEISNVTKIKGIDLPTRARRLVKTGQVIVSSIEGSLSSCALIDEENNNALCSTGFYVVDSEKINSETLLLLFKSAPIQALLKQGCSGTILTAISKDEFIKIPLPLVEENKQKEIAEKVQESFSLRKKSKRLLAIAIKAVEIAVETDEVTAMQWLTEQSQ